MKRILGQALLVLSIYSHANNTSSKFDLAPLNTLSVPELLERMDWKSLKGADVAVCQEALTAKFGDMKLSFLTRIEGTHVEAASVISHLGIGDDIGVEILGPADKGTHVVLDLGPTHVSQLVSNSKIPMAVKVTPNPPVVVDEFLLNKKVTLEVIDGQYQGSLSVTVNSLGQALIERNDDVGFTSKAQMDEATLMGIAKGEIGPAKIIWKITTGKIKLLGDKAFLLKAIDMVKQLAGAK